MTTDVVFRVIDALNESDIPYMLVGSLAANLYMIPRSTVDADFVLESAGPGLSALVFKLGREFRMDEQMSFETVTFSRKLELTHLPTKFRFELFLLSDEEYDHERFSRRTRAPFDHRTVWTMTVEDVIVTKLRWNRKKDLMDATDVINFTAAQRMPVDWDYVHHWCDIHGTRKLLDEIRAEIPPL